MKGTGRQLLCLEDEKPLQCALGEFSEETQVIIPKKLITNRIQNKNTTSFEWLFNITGKFVKTQVVDGSAVTIEWKYIIYFMILNSYEIDTYKFISKCINEIGIETEACAWVKYDMITSGKMNVSNKTKKSL